MGFVLSNVKKPRMDSQAQEMGSGDVWEDFASHRVPWRREVGEDENCTRFLYPLVFPA